MRNKDLFIIKKRDVPKNIPFRYISMLTQIQWVHSFENRLNFFSQDDEVDENDIHKHADEVHNYDE